MRIDQAMGTNRAPNALKAASNRLGAGRGTGPAPSSRAWRTRPRQTAPTHTRTRDAGSARKRRCVRPVVCVSRSWSSKSDAPARRRPGPRWSGMRRLSGGFSIPAPPRTQGSARGVLECEFFVVAESVPPGSSINCFKFNLRRSLTYSRRMQHGRGAREVPRACSPAGLPQ